MEALKAFAVIFGIFFFPSYYLWTRGYKKTLLAFIGAIFSMFVFVAGILADNTPLMIGSVVFMPLCFCLYFLYSNRVRIVENFRSRQYTSKEGLFWILPLGIAFCIDAEYISYVFLCFFASIFLMTDFEGSFAKKLKFVFWQCATFWLMVVLLYVLGHISSRFY